VVTAVAEVRPLLRGWSHAAAIAPAAGGTVALTLLSRGDAAKQATLVVYGAALTLLFSVSALYHRGNWSPRVESLLRRVDHADISLLIAGTYTPIAVVLLDGAPRFILLAGTWTAALAGVVIAITGARLGRGWRAALYVATGWLAVAALPALYGRVGAGGLAVLAGGGVLYSIGAVAYASRRPALWPRVFGYHEVFHLLVIAATALFFGFIAVNVVGA
jgi:hemolysin III